MMIAMEWRDLQAMPTAMKATQLMAEVIWLAHWVQHPNAVMHFSALTMGSGIQLLFRFVLPTLYMAVCKLKKLMAV